MVGLEADLIELVWLSRVWYFFRVEQGLGVKEFEESGWRKRAFKDTDPGFVFSVFFLNFGPFLGAFWRIFFVFSRVLDQLQVMVVVFVSASASTPGPEILKKPCPQKEVITKTLTPRRTKRKEGLVISLD